MRKMQEACEMLVRKKEGIRDLPFGALHLAFIGLSSSV